MPFLPLLLVALLAPLALPPGFGATVPAPEFTLATIHETRTAGFHRGAAPRPGPGVPVGKPPSKAPVSTAGRVHVVKVLDESGCACTCMIRDEIVRIPGDAVTETAVPGTSPVLPMKLRAVYPNPVRESSVVAFQTGDSRRFQLLILDLRGRRVRTLVDAVLTPGVHQASWDGTGDDGRPAANGVYFLRLVDGAKQDTRKVVLAR
jgi:hypothetical protein